MTFHIQFIFGKRKFMFLHMKRKDSNPKFLNEVKYFNMHILIVCVHMKFQHVSMYDRIYGILEQVYILKCIGMYTLTF